MANTNNVKGLSELLALLETLPANVERNIMRGALRAGAKLVGQTAKELCPVGPPSYRGAKIYGLYAGALRDSIRLKTKIEGQRISASVVAGGKYKGANIFYAHIIEFTGAASHKIVPKVGGSLFLGGVFATVANHPGMRARPFMRPALDARAADATLAIAEYVKKRLATKEGLTAAADVEVEAIS